MPPAVRRAQSPGSTSAVSVTCIILLPIKNLENGLGEWDVAITST